MNRADPLWLNHTDKELKSVEF